MISNSNKSTTGLIQRYLGSSFDIVTEVAENLDYITLVAQALESGTLDIASLPADQFQLLIDKLGNLNFTQAELEALYSIAGTDKPDILEVAKHINELKMITDNIGDLLLLSDTVNKLQTADASIRDALAKVEASRDVAADAAIKASNQLAVINDLIAKFDQSWALTDAPSTGDFYARKDGSWQRMTIPVNDDSAVQSNGAISVGLDAGQDPKNNNGNTQEKNAVAIGTEAGQVTQGESTVAVGEGAGNDSQSANGVAVGAYAGTLYQQPKAVAIGSLAGLLQQHDSAVAIGYAAAQKTQGIRATAIGPYAGSTPGVDATADTYSQPSDSIAIGHGARPGGEGDILLITDKSAINATSTHLDWNTNGNVAMRIMLVAGGLRFLNAYGLDITLNADGTITDNRTPTS